MPHTVTLPIRGLHATAGSIADWPLRTKMAVLLLVASLLPMLAVNWLSMRQIGSLRQQDSAELLGARGDEVVGRIDTFVAGYQSGVARMAASPNVARILQAPAADREALIPQIRSLLDAWPQSDSSLRGVAVLDAQGVVVAATEPALEGKDLSYRPFVAWALRGESTVSDVFRSEAETGSVPTLALIAPMRAPDGTVRGLAAFWIRAEVLSSILKESNGQAGPGSFAIVFDRFGIRIAHSYIDELVFHPGVRLDAATVESLVAEQRFGPETRSLMEDVQADVGELSTGRRRAAGHCGIPRVCLGQFAVEFRGGAPVPDGAVDGLLPGPRKSGPGGYCRCSTSPAAPGRRDHVAGAGGRRRLRCIHPAPAATAERWSAGVGGWRPVGSSGHGSKGRAGSAGRNFQ